MTTETKCEDCGADTRDTLTCDDCYQSAEEARLSREHERETRREQEREAMQGERP